MAIHPLVAEQVRRSEVKDGSGGGGGNGSRRRGGDIDAGSNRGRLTGLTPEERMKQMDRDALNARSDSSTC